MLNRYGSLFTKRGAVALALTAVMVAAAAGWKMGSGEAFGRYLTGPVTLVSMEDTVTVLGLRE